MAGTSTTPELATMPTEIVCMIGADLSIHDIKEWTLVSKRFRDIFLSQICKHIKFSGNIEQQESNILSYFQTATTSFKNVVHHNARCVTFDVRAFDTPRGLRAWARAAWHSPIRRPQIGQFIISNPYIHQVTFNIRFELVRELFLFMNIVEAGPQWSNVKNVSFQSPHHNAGALRTVIEKLEEGTLQTISTCCSLFIMKDSMRNSYFSNVTSLSLRMQSFENWWWISHHHDPVIPGLDKDILATIHTSFPKLESLVLYYGTPDDRSSNRPLTNIAKVARIDMKAISTLQKMQSLRRFAFEFDKSRLDPDSIPEILERTPNAFNDMISDDWAEELVADFLMLALLVHNLSTIEEICIKSEYPHFYRATLTDGEWEFNLDSFDDPSQKDLFPSVLMG